MDKKEISILLSKQDSKVIKVACIILMMLFSIGICVFAATPPVGTRLKDKNIGKSTSTQDMVLNVYTSGTPVSGDTVTIYAASGSASQSWKNLTLPGGGFRFALYYDTGGLSLNYQQSTTKCTVYPYGSNVLDDYKLRYDPGDYGALIVLNERGRFLGTSSNSSTTVCYWYTGFANADDNWTFSQW